jgi:hypothetical protein
LATSGVSGSIVMTTSACSATSRGLAQGVAPAAAISAGTLLRVCTNSRWPAAIRWPPSVRP